jgi:hypothetical protein
MISLALSAIFGMSVTAIETPSVRCVLVVPPNVRPWADAQERLDLVLKDAQWWYSCQMEAHGYGSKTFALELDPSGKVVVHVTHLKEPIPPTTDSTALRSAVVEAAEKIVGSPGQRKGTVMFLMYNGYYWSDMDLLKMKPMGSGLAGRWAHFSAWHYYSINPSGWHSNLVVPNLPDQNPFFPPLATNVLQAFAGDGIKSVAERTSAGHGACFTLLGLAFGLKHADRSRPRLHGNVMDAQFWQTRGSFLESISNEWSCISARDAEILNRNPLFQVRDVGPPSSGAARSTGMRGVRKDRSGR